MNQLFNMTLILVILITTSTSYSEVTEQTTDFPSTPAIRPKRRQNNKVLSFEIQAKTNIPLDSGYRHIVPQNGLLRTRCVGSNQYFNADGTLGSKGQVIAREMVQGNGARSTPMKHLFFESSINRMNQLCKNFENFSYDQKLNFWIWYFASIANTESECGRNAYNPNDPRGTSVGELQLPEAWENRHWRGLIRFPKGDERNAGGCNALPPPATPPSYTYKKPPESLMARTENNLVCGVEILAGVLCGFYSHPTEQCNNRTYSPFGHGFWKKLRGGLSGPIVADIRSFPLCGN